MGGLGNQEGSMYILVDDSESHRYRSACSRILTETRDELKDKYDIISQFTLVGSGARNLITRNGNGPYDLDYNLEIIKAPDNAWNNLKQLKETVRNCLNHAVGGNEFSDGKDSTAVLTSIRYFTDEPNVEFSFDVAIVTRNESGTLMRLIHNKNAWQFGSSGQYTWNEVKSSHDVLKKAKYIKDSDGWIFVRDRYVELKNMYLERHDNDHPSFIVYVEAVNEIYQKIKGGKRK